MNTPATARKGVYAGVAGTAIAILVTWAEPQRRPSPVDRPRDRRGIRRRRAAVAGAAHGGAAADGAVARVRRAGRRPGRHRRSTTCRLSEGAGEPHGVPDGRAHRRGHPRLSHVHRQPDGRRQAAGSEVGSAAAGHLSAAERDQPRCCSRSPSALAVALAMHPTADWAPIVFPVDHRAGAALRRAADHSDRRRRHADRHRDPELRTPACRPWRWASCSTTSC